MRSPPGAFAGLGVAWSRAGKGGGDPARGGATPNGVLGSGKGLQATGASARERGDRGGAHQARNWAESWCSSTGGGIRAAALGGACGGSGCRSFPCAWISRNDAVPCCEVERGSGRAGTSTAARKNGCGETHPRRGTNSNPMMQVPCSRKVAARLLLVLGRSSCVGFLGLWRGRAVGPRRRGTLLWAERRGGSC